MAQSLVIRNVDLLEPSSPYSVPRSPIIDIPNRALSVQEILLSPRLSSTVANNHVDDSFVFTFDLHNDWDEPFKVEFDIYNDNESDLPTSTCAAVIHAGVTKRYIKYLT